MSSPPAGLFARLLRLCEHPRALPAIAALAVLLCLPTLQIGLYSDDYAHLAQIERTVPPLSHSSPLDLYRFVPADRAEFSVFQRYGPVPWFADPALKLHFFRPLSSALIAFDHAVWGRNPIGYHLTSIALYAALVLAAGRLFRAITGERGAPITAIVATLVFAVDPTHFQPASWTAGRHLVVAAIPAAIGLWMHVRHVRDGFRLGAWLAPLALVVALLAGEAALGAVAYWLAYDWLGPGPRDVRARLRASAPIIAISVVYAIAYKTAGLGAVGSGGYFDPASDPRGFADALAVRLPAMLGDYFLRVPSEMIAFLPPAPFVVVGLVAVAGMFVLYRLARPAIPDDERAALAWLIPGAIGALILASGGFPGGRLLLFPGFGFAFFVAVLIHRGASRLVRALLVFLHLVVGPLAFVGGAFSQAELARQQRDVVDRAEIVRVGKPRVVVLAASDPMVSFYAPVVVALLTPEIAETWQVLSGAKVDHRVTRTGPSSLRLELLGGRMLQGAFESLWRTPRHPFAAGDRVELAGVTVTVAAVDRGAPTAIDVAFDVPLEHPDLYLMTWRDGHLARVSPPPVGGTVDLPWSPGPFRFF